VKKTPPAGKLPKLWPAALERIDPPVAAPVAADATAVPASEPIESIMRGPVAETAGAIERGEDEEADEEERYGARYEPRL